MEYPDFSPAMPKGYQFAVTMVRWTGHGTLVTYDVWSETGYREQRCAFVTKHRGVKWDQIMWSHAGDEYVKEHRAQKVDRVRLLPKRRRHW